MRVSVLPFFSSLKGYDLEKLKQDFVAGMTVGLVLIPQSMAYAQLAGLPSYYGLYASFLPPLVAAVFGSSRRLATGPVAVVSIMTAAALEPLAVSGSSAFISYAVVLAFMVGVFQFLLGLFRLGVVVNLLSHPVIVGFTNGAALIIASSQLSRFFGVHVDKAPHYYQTMARVYQAAVDFIHWPTLFLGLTAMVTMVVVKKISARSPCVLIAVVLTTVISWATGFENNRHANVEEIHVAGLKDKLVNLNVTCDHVRQATLLRKSVSPGHGDDGKNTRQLCSRCHPGREVELLRQGRKVARSTQPVASENVLELHFMAGVLDAYIAGEKERARRLRREIRSLHLVRVQGKQGEQYFVRSKDAGGAEKLDSAVWRIRVDAAKIDLQHLFLVGGGEVIGEIPRGLPSISMPSFSMESMPGLVVPAIIISILGFMESISVAKAIAAKTGCRLDPNQELIGQGMANLLGSLGSSYPVSGSFSRSAINFQNGAQTGLSSVFTSLMVVGTLLFFTPLLYYLPQSVLAAIIMMAVAGLLNVQDIVHAWKVRRSDGIISVITFVATLFFAPHLDKGILLGVFLSIAVFFYRKMKPVIAELSLWEDGHYRSAARFRLRQCRHIVVIRFDGPLFFANISFLEDEVLRIVKARKELSIVHLKCNGINEIDASGERALALLVDRLHAGGYAVTFSGLKLQIMDILQETGLVDRIGRQNIFPTLAAAMENIWPRVHNDDESAYCPLKKVIRENDGEIRVT
jgi:MFS superfamily sulfate permease-like transporter